MSVPARNPYLLPEGVPKVHVFAAARKSARGKPAGATLEASPAPEVTAMSHERDYLARAFFFGGAVYMVLAAMFDPQSMSNYLVEHSIAGWMPIAAIAGAALLLLLDMLINDLLPERFQFDAAYNHRPEIYMVIAFLYLVPLYAAARAEVRSVTVSGVFLHIGMAAMGVTLAVHAVVKRHRYRFGGAYACSTSP